MGTQVTWKATQSLSGWDWYMIIMGDIVVTAAVCSLLFLAWMALKKHGADIEQYNLLRDTQNEHTRLLSQLVLNTNDTEQKMHVSIPHVQEDKNYQDDTNAQGDNIEPREIDETSTVKRL